MIKKKELDKISALISDPKDVQKWINQFKVDEPNLYANMLQHANYAIGGIIKLVGRVDERTVGTIHMHVCIGYLLMFTLLKHRDTTVFDKIRKYDHFQQFIEGELPSSYYKYSLKGLDPESSLYRAKIAHSKQSLIRLRKALLPIIAQDVGLGTVGPEVLRIVDEKTRMENNNGKRGK